MKKAALAALIVASLALAGCDMFQSKEAQCLESVRLQFKDPDSAKVVQNLGRRGQDDSYGAEFFWLRYKAKNSYGAYLSKNMACEKGSDGKWVHSRFRELMGMESAKQHALKQKLADIERQNAALAACKGKNALQCEKSVMGDDFGVPSDELQSRRVQQANDQAKAQVFDSIEDLEAPNPPAEQGTAVPSDLAHAGTAPASPATCPRLVAMFSMCS